MIAIGRLRILLSHLLAVLVATSLFGLVGCASDAGTSGTSTTARTLTALEIAPASPAAAAGTSVQLSATAIYSDNSHQDVTALTSWGSSNTAIATVGGATGTAQGIVPGSVTISAQYQNLIGSTTLTITTATLVSVAVTPPSPSIAAGTQRQLVATGTFSDNSTQNLTADMVWVSSNTAVATVGSGGLVTSRVAGSATVTATCALASVCGSIGGSATLTVTAATLVSIEVTPVSPNIALGTAQQLEATGIFTDHSTQDLTSQVAWASNDTGVATISNVTGSNGSVTTVAVGSAQVSASLGGVVSNHATVTVTPAVLVCIAVTPPSPSIANGTREQFTATGTYTDNSTQNLAAQVTWSSSAIGVATVSNAVGSYGLATSTGTGSTLLTAAMGTVSGSSTLTVTPATLVSIAVTPPSPSVPNGLTQQFTATGTYTDNTTQDLTNQVTWSSASSGVATVSNAAATQGLASSANLGTTVITAALGSVSGSSTLTVTAATLVSIAVTPPSPSVPNGLAQPFTATGTYTDNTTQDLTAQVTWSSSAPTVATISNASGTTGLASSAGVGGTVITATSGSVSGSSTLTVTVATLVSITVTPPSPSVPNGLTQQFTATGTYSDNTTKDLTTQVTWGSANTGVATVSNAAGTNGLASSTGLGTTVITATAADGTSGGSTLTITAAALVSVAVTPVSATVPSGVPKQFVATGTYTDNTTQNLTAQVTWSSANTSVATISNAVGTNGLASSAATGTATITATAADGTSGNSTLTVTAAALVSITVTPASPSVPNGLPQQFTATGAYTDSTTQDITSQVTWSSSAPTVATISNATGTTGLASSAGVGNTVITATSGTVSGSAGLTVTAAALTAIAVTPADPSIAKGTTQRFAATGTYTDNSTRNITMQVTWSSSAVGVTTLSNAAGAIGVATALNVGSSTVSAALSGISGSTTLSVTPATLVSIHVTPGSPSVVSAGTQQFTATGTYTDNSTQNLTQAVAWSSSNTAVATISNAAGSNGLASVAATAISGSTSSISASSGTVSGATTLTVAAATGYAYVVNRDDNTLSEYAIAPGGGLIPIGTITTGNQPYSAAADSTGSYLYVANFADDNISEYVIGAGGLLTPMNTATVGAGSGPVAVATHPTGSYVYVTNSAGNNISQYTIGAGGVLTPASPATVASGNSPQDIVVSPNGAYVYVANEASNTVSLYTVGPLGALAPMGVPTVAVNDGPASLAVDPAGQYLYVGTSTGADEFNLIYQYPIPSNGELSSASSSTFIPDNCLPLSMVASVSALYTACSTGSNEVWAFSFSGLSSSGEGNISQDIAPYGVAMDPSRKYLYVVNEGDKTVSQYILGSGLLYSLMSPATVPSGTTSISITTVAAH